MTVSAVVMASTVHPVIGMIEGSEDDSAEGVICSFNSTASGSNATGGTGTSGSLAVMVANSATC